MSLQKTLSSRILLWKFFKLLPADRFSKKTYDVLGGNRLRSSIEMEMMKAPKKSISLLQSKYPLFKTIETVFGGCGGGCILSDVPHNCSGLVAFKG